MGHELKREEVLSIFIAAGIPVLNMKPLPNGYSYQPPDPRYRTTYPDPPWWFVKTPVGWIEIGWRKRVISINWEDTPIRHIVTAKEVTKDEQSVHAWSILEAIEFLIELRKQFPSSVTEQEKHHG